MTQNDLQLIQPANNVCITLNSGETTNYYESVIYFQHGNVTRFAIEKDNAANHDLYIRRYNSSGVLQDSPIKIDGSDGSLTLTQTGTFSIAYDSSNHLDFTVSSAGAVKLTAVGSADSIELETGDGDIVLDAKDEIDLDPEGNVINLLGNAAGNITLDATSITIYGGDTTGDDLVLYGNSTDTTVLSVLGTTGVTIGGAMTTGLEITTTAAANAISIDAGTTDSTSSTIITCDLDVNSANCNFLNVTIDIGTLLSAGEIVKGSFFDITEAVVNENTSQIIAYDTAITGFATGRADLVGYKCLIDGSKTGGDTENGVLVDVNATINHSGEVLCGYKFDATGMTLTDGAVYGTYIDMTFTNGSTAYGAYIVSGADTTAAIGIDCGTIDSTGASAIDIDFDVNSASANCVSLDVNVGTALSSAETVNGISIDIDGDGGDAADAYMNGIYLTSSNTTTGVNTGVNLVGTWDTAIAIGASGAAMAFTAATQRGMSSYITSDVTSGNIVSMSINQTLTSASATNTTELSQFILTSDVQVGNWANAVLGKIDFSTNGYVTGLAGVFCAEIDLPNSSTGGAGTYSCYEAEINCPASYEGNAPIHVFQINAWGAGVTEFDDNGYLFDLTGVSSGATSMWYDNQKAAPAVEEFIRVKTPSGVRYLALYDANS